MNHQVSNDFRNEFPRRIESESLRATGTAGVNANSILRLQWPSNTPSLPAGSIDHQFAGLMRQLHDGPEVRLEVVTEVRLRLGMGYYIDGTTSQQTAEAMLGISQAGDSQE